MYIEFSMRLHELDGRYYKHEQEKSTRSFVDFCELPPLVAALLKSGQRNIEWFFPEVDQTPLGPFRLLEQIMARYEAGGT